MIKLKYYVKFSVQKYIFTAYKKPSMLRINYSAQTNQYICFCHVAGIDPGCLQEKQQAFPHLILVSTPFVSSHLPPPSSSLSLSIASLLSQFSATHDLISAVASTDALSEPSPIHEPSLPVSDSQILEMDAKARNKALFRARLNAQKKEKRIDSPLVRSVLTPPLFQFCFYTHTHIYYYL